MVFSSHKENIYKEMINLQSYIFFMFKEVIQPQVPLRLPCYDFALLKEPRFDPNQ